MKKQQLSYSEMLEKERSSKPAKTQRKLKRALNVSRTLLYSALALGVGTTYSFLNRLRHQNQPYDTIDPDFLKYSTSEWPSSNITANILKSQEGYLFQQIAGKLNGVKLEIGFFDGVISALHLPDTVFDYGTEYYSPALKKNRVLDRWRTRYQCSIDCMPAINDLTIDDIVMIHVFDHLPDPHSAFQELSRIHKEGGTIYFSGMSDYRYKATIRYWMVQKFLKPLLEGFVTRYVHELGTSRSHYNFLDKNAMRAFLEQHDYEMLEFRYFNGDGFLTYFANLFHYGFVKRGAFKLEFFKHSPLFQRIFTWMYVSIGYPYYLKLKKADLAAGRDFFVVARKNSNDRLLAD
jgi:SAM-dependent methyltransferase